MKGVVVNMRSTLGADSALFVRASVRHNEAICCSVYLQTALLNNKSLCDLQEEFDGSCAVSF